jgi:hypothetical protein
MQVTGQVRTKVKGQMRRQIGGQVKTIRETICEGTGETTDETIG